MRNARLGFLVLVLLNLTWSAQWWWQGQHDRNQVARDVATLLGVEVQMGLEPGAFRPGPVLQRLKSVAALKGAQIRSADNRTMWQFGATSPGWLRGSSAISEAGQHLASLQLHFHSPAVPVPLWLGWLATLIMLPLLRGTDNEPAPAQPKGGALVLELDGQRRIRRLSGEIRLLGCSAEEAIGSPLEALLAGSGANAGRTLSEVPGLSRHGRSLVVMRDSQDQKRAARRIQQLEAQYRNLCDFAHDLIIVAGPEGNIIFANRALQQASPVAGTRDVQVFELFDERGLEDVRSAFHGCLLDGTEATVEAELRTADGGTMPLRGSFCPGQWHSGVPTTVLGIFQDLSEQRRAEADLRQAQKMEAIGRLAGGVAHDFNNLLTIMCTLGSLMRYELDDSKALSENLDEMDQTIGRAAELTQQLLLFSRKKLHKQEVLLVDDVIRDMVRLASRLLGEDIELEVSLQANCWVAADRSELEQVIMNLLVNARDALANGGRIRLASLTVDGEVRFSVEDNGVGMSEETRARIYEPYFTTKDVGKGTGLGLSTTYAIVGRWGGRIEVESALGRGTTFTIILAVVAEPVVVPEPQPAGELPAAGNETVLLVEDEESLCRTTSKSLQLQGYEVISCTVPQQALGWFHSPDFQPSILVTDLVMPGMSGAELAQHARDLRPDLKVLFVSGYPGESLQALTDLDRAHFMPKPYRCEELGRRIRTLLDDTSVAEIPTALAGKRGHSE